MRVSLKLVSTLIGNAVPLIAIVGGFPWLHRELGTAGFGFFMAGWGSLGYTSVLDLGLGRTITHYTALHSKSGSHEDLLLANAAFAFLLLLGLAVTTLLSAAWFCYGRVKGLSFGNVSYVAWAPLILCVPLATATSGIRGAIEGNGRLVTAALLRAVSGPLHVLLPMAFVAHSATVVAVAMGFASSRFVVLGLYWVTQKARSPILKPAFWLRPTGSMFRRVLAYSSWVGVSNVVGTAIAYMDRIILPLGAGLSEFAFYATPFEIGSRLLVIPGSIVTVIFPSLSRVKDEPAEIRVVVRDAYISCAILMIPAALVILVCGGALLDWWMGHAFALRSVAILQVIAVGVVFNALAHIPFAAIQAMGCPQVAAVIQIAEFLPTILLFYTLIQFYGAIGAAMGWATRSFLDFAIMHVAYTTVIRRLSASKSRQI